MFDPSVCRICTLISIFMTIFFFKLFQNDIELDHVKLIGPNFIRVVFYCSFSLCHLYVIMLTLDFCLFIFEH
jgi:hypothetical protein